MFDQLRRLPAVVLIVLVAGAPVSALAADGQPEGRIGSRLVAVPMTTDDDPRSTMYVVEHVAPGSSVQRQLEIANTTDAVARVRVYAAAASFERGTFAGAAGRIQNELSGWTSVTPSAVDLAAGASAIASITVVVPDDATSGERYGVVWVETRGAPGLDGVTQIARVGTRMYVSVGPGGKPAAEFTISSVAGTLSDGGMRAVSATVRNTGAIAISLSGALSLSKGPGGLSGGPFPVLIQDTLAVGATAPVLVVLDERLPVGSWRAQITLRSGAVERSSSAIIKLAAATAAPAGSSAAMYAITGLLSLAGLGALLMQRRSRRRLVVGRRTRRRGARRMIPA